MVGGRGRGRPFAVVVVFAAGREVVGGVVPTPCAALAEHAAPVPASATRAAATSTVTRDGQLRGRVRAGTAPSVAPP